MATTVALLQNLTDALTSASAAFPDDEKNLLPPSDGISLLDVKNDLLLSYLQYLAFLIVLRLRNAQEIQNSSLESSISLNEEAVKKIVELRVLMERGVRPLEGKLRYQIDKVLRVADDAERTAALLQKTKKSQTVKGSGKAQKADKNGGSDFSDASVASGSDDGSDAQNSGSEAGSDDDGWGGNKNHNQEAAQELMYRPNAAALAQRIRSDQKDNSFSASRTQRGDKGRNSASGGAAAAGGGVYRPPRITATAMPSLPTTGDGERDRDTTAQRRRRKANLVDEYIDEEISTAIRAQPSIGSNNTILAQGRGGLSARDREKERERREYEESNFTRLPTESKAERRKAKARGERERRDMFGGEDWTGLGGLGDRINKSVGRPDGSNNNKTNNILERREKRKRATEDMPRGDGMASGSGTASGLGMGHAFEKRKQVLDDRAERKKKRRKD